MVDSELRALSEAEVNSRSLSTRNHSDRLNATVPRRCGHTLQLLSGSSRGTHLAGITVCVQPCSATAAGLSSLAVCSVSVNDRGIGRLPLMGMAITDVLAWFITVPRLGRWVSGKCREYRGYTDRVFVDAISMESNISYNRHWLLV